MQIPSVRFPVNVARSAGTRAMPQIAVDVQQDGQAGSDSADKRAFVRSPRPQHVMRMVVEAQMLEARLQTAPADLATRVEARQALEQVDRFDAPRAAEAFRSVLLKV